MDPGGSLVKTTWPPLLIVAAAMTTLSSNVSLIPPKKLPLYLRTARRAWLVFCCWDKHLLHFSSSCFSSDLSGIIIACDHQLDFLAAIEIVQLADTSQDKRRNLCATVGAFRPIRNGLVVPDSTPHHITIHSTCIVPTITTFELTIQIFAITWGVIVSWTRCLPLPI